jgi:hypothetical protein
MSEIVNEAVIKVTADASGVESGLRKVTEHTGEVATGLRRVEEVAQKTGRTLENLGNGPGLRNVGDGAGQAAGQVDRATKNMADAIQRATASMSAGTKGTAEYYAALANSRGINVAALKPYLEQLDEVTRKSALAAEAQKRLDDSTRFLADLRTRSDSIGKTASQLAEMRAAQLGVSDSARPMIEQLRAAEEATESVGSKFGKTKVALLALGTAAVAGAAMFVSMFKDAVDAADELGDLSKSTGVAVEDLAGLKLAAEQSGAELSGVADSINKLSMNIGKDGAKFRELGITAKDPLEAFKQLADLFASIQDPQTRAALGAATLGKSWAAAAPLLAEGGARIGEMIDKGKQLSGMTQEMVDRSDEFNDKMAELTATMSGFKTRIAVDMLPGLNQATSAIMDAYVESGKLQAVWVALGSVGAFLFTNEFASAKVKLKDLREELSDLEADLSLSKDTPGFGIVGRLFFGNTDSALEEKIRSVKAEIKALQDQMNPPTPFVDEFGDRFMSSVAAYGVNRTLGDKTEEEKQAREREAAIKAEASSYAGLITSIRERITASKQEADGLKPLTESQRLQISLDEQLRAGKLALTPAHKAEYEAAIKKLSVNEAIIASNKRLQASEELELKGKAAAEAELRSIGDQVKAQQQANEQIGLTGYALVALQASRLDDAAAQKEQTAAAIEFLEPGDQQAQTYRDQAAALRDLATAKKIGAVKQAAADDATKALAEQKEMWQSIERTAHDTFISIFDSGKSAFDRLRDTLKNGLYDLLYQMTVKQWIINIGASVTGSGGGAASLPQAGSTVASGGSSLSSIGGLAGMTNYAGSAIAGIGNFVGSSSVSAFGAGFAGNSAGMAMTASETFASAGMAAEASAASFGASVASALPYVGALIAAYAIYKKLDDSGTYHTGGASYADSTGSRTIRAESIGFAQTRTAADTEKMTSGLVQGVVGILDSTAATFGKTAGYTAATAFADDTSKDGAWGALVIKNMDGTVLDWNQTRNSGWAPREFDDGQKGQEQYLAELSKSVRTALDGIGLPTWAKGMLNALDSNAGLDEIAQVVQEINKTQNALKGIGQTMSVFADLSDGMASKLIAAAGGIDSLANSAAAYYDKFYTDAEKTAATMGQVGKVLQSVGLSIPATKEEFRDLVEANMALGEAGAKTVAALLSVSGAYAEVKDIVGESTVDLSSYRAKLTEAYNAESQALQATISRMGSFAAGLRDLNKSALLGALSPLSPQQKYAEARSQYEAVAAAARNGDEGAQDRYQDVRTAFLEASRLVNASGAGYRQDFDYAQAVTSELAAWTEGQVSVDQAQLDVLKTQVNGIIEINDSVLSVREALLEYNQALAQQANPGAVPTNAPIPYYASEGRTNNAALEAEVYGLRTELAGLRADQQQQTGDTIVAQTDAAGRAAAAIEKALSNPWKLFGDKTRVAPQ